VWPISVVIDLPGCDLAPGVPEIPKPVRVQTFIPKPAMEAFDVPILCGLAGLNVNGADAALHAPRQVMPAADLRTII